MDYTNINCTLNCIFQKDGKCTLNIINIPQNVPIDAECPHFKYKK